MERRDAPSFQAFLQQWRRSSSGASAIFDTPDGRWAVVSTFVTVLVAGAVAWLAAGTVPPAISHGDRFAPGRTLLPYQLFMRLASQGNATEASYAAFGPSAAIASRPATAGLPPASLDNALANEDAGDDGNTSPGPDARTVTLEPGDTLAGALSDAGVTGEDATAAMAALRKVYDPRAIRAGQSFDLAFSTAVESPAARITYTPPGQGAADDGETADAEPVDAPPLGRLLSIRFSPSVEHDITVSRTAGGDFSAQDVKKDLVARNHRAGAKIDSSLYLAAMQAGIPADVVVQMIHIFSYQVDFQRDIHPGDTFEVFYSYYYTPDGKPVRQGDIDYAAMTLGGKTMALYRYQARDSDSADYLDAKGRSAKSLLMKTPVDGARISSGFGMRFHPVLGYTRMHKGVDFAVPVGTPVMAAGSGTIRFEGREHGYGNFLLIKHDSVYSTAYGHLSRFAAGLHNGSHVRQGQVVAYSGNTGLTTGPHLHYEIRVNGNQINPVKVKIATGIQLGGRALRAFLAERLHIDSELAAMPLETKVAENTGELRTAKD